MNNTNPKLLFQIALTQITGIGDTLARTLVSTIGDEELVFKASKKELTAIKGISSKLADHIIGKEALLKAEQEILFLEKNNIQTFYYKSDTYPSRLKECNDAPILFYFKGKANLNESKIISIVGTRQSTEYGNHFCSDFLEELSSKTPDILVVSGLAYGIDICAHKAALKNNIATVGVLAHGLDRIYPATHRNTAVEMLNCGGLLTEFISGTAPDKFNFVKRNRIVAGISDATIVVESNKKGGSLITADLANSYNREVFAVPGRIYDSNSIGCNMLIEENKAALLQSADSFIRFMGWDVIDVKAKIKNKQQQLFFDLTNEEQLIIKVLAEKENLHINVLASETQLSMSTLLSMLLMMEMKGVIKAATGNIYSLA